MKVFVDSDVIISSLLSKSGAAYLLLNKSPKEVKFFISNVSRKELKRVIKRFNSRQEKLKRLIEKRLKITHLKTPVKKLKTKYEAYTSDPNDTHIVAGAKETKVKFLLTYNHFKKDKIKKAFNITTLTPAKFLQFLRSRN